MNPFNDAMLFLKERVKSGFYRQVSIPDDKTKEVTKRPKMSAHDFGNRFATLALSQALADMGKQIVPEKPQAGGTVSQPQMQEVFGPGRHDYRGHHDDVNRIKYDPLMQMLNLSDTKGVNVGLHDEKVKVFDPAYRTFRRHKATKYGLPIDFDNYTYIPELLNYKRVPKDELNDLTEGVKNYKDNFDIWGDEGRTNQWQEGMVDYHSARNALQFLNSIKQDPQQTKLFEHTDPLYAQMLQEIR